MGETFSFSAGAIKARGGVIRVREKVDGEWDR